ncbi:MAG: GNAT family N-acetyltransferase [Actinomycetota bacterium]|nr:GNAT family N-acetyltransferase [Actinomycetota bacterium]
MALDVHLECDERCFDLPEWRTLLDRDPNAHIFATPEWSRLWWEELGSGKELFLLKMMRGDDVAALVPLYRKPEPEGDSGCFRFVGGIELTDYLGPICSEGDRAEVAEALIEWLADAPVEWTEFDAHNMPVPFGFAEFLVERADNRGFRFALEQEETSAVLPLPGDWDSYLQSLDSKQRHELRRKRRRIGRDHPDAAFRTSTEDTLEGDLKIFIDMHRGAQGRKGHFLFGEIVTFFERIAKAFMPLGWLRLDFLEIAGKPVASTFSFEFGNSFYLYNSAYDDEAARVSPGLVLVSELVKRSIDNGLDRFDFLRGPERYKYQLGGQAVPLNNVRVLNEPKVGA